MGAFSQPRIHWHDYGHYSLLFSTGDTTATVARTDTAAVRCFYQVISTTE